MSEPAARSLGCARCGDCCEHIWLSAGVVQGLEVAAAQAPAPGPNLTFIAEHWTEIERASDGAVRYVCDAFDVVRRQCAAHDDRPPVCRGFPWYGREPGDLQGGVISSRCSYWLDVPASRRLVDARPLLPLIAPLTTRRYDRREPRESPSGHNRLERTSPYRPEGSP